MQLSAENGVADTILTGFMWKMCAIRSIINRFGLLDGHSRVAAVMVEYRRSVCMHGMLHYCSDAVRECFFVHVQHSIHIVCAAVQAQTFRQRNSNNKKYVNRSVVVADQHLCSFLVPFSLFFLDVLFVFVRCCCFYFTCIDWCYFCFILRLIHENVHVFFIT